MILYSLRCAAGCAFDGWFRSSGDCDDQIANGLIACPTCGSGHVEKALMAPAVALSGDARPAPVAGPSAERDVAVVDEKHAKLRGMLRDLRAEMTRNSEDVGDRFATVARRMHDEEIEHRTIHGRATAEDAKALMEDGVQLHALPTFPDDLN